MIPDENRDFDEFTPDIIQGAKNNDIIEVSAALELDWQDIFRRDIDNGFTALHHASVRGNSSMVSFLLDQKGVDINLKDHWDRDPLDVAIISGNQDVIDDLFRYRHLIFWRD